MQAVLGEGAALILHAVHILPSSTAGGNERWKHDGRKREHSRCSQKLNEIRSEKDSLF